MLNEIDQHKTAQALPANIIQAQDAALAQFIISHMECFTVHDCFGVNLFSVHTLMDLCNKYFNTGLRTDNYAMFILL